MSLYVQKEKGLPLDFFTNADGSHHLCFKSDSPRQHLAIQLITDEEEQNSDDRQHNDGDTGAVTMDNAAATAGMDLDEAGEDEMGEI